MAVTDNRVIVSCSFCLKPDNKVAKLVAGPGVYICNECVDLCSQIIGSPPSLPPGLTSWEEDRDLERVLVSLPRMAAAGAQVDSNLSRFVKRVEIAWRHVGGHRNVLWG